MKSRVLALAGVAIVVAGSLAFTFPSKKEVAKQNAASEKIDADKEPLGGFVIDNKD
jgi:hypothetical protein